MQKENKIKYYLIILLFLCMLPNYVYSGNLEPFKSVPVPEQNPQTPEKIELGKMLFFDRRLS